MTNDDIIFEPIRRQTPSGKCNKFYEEYCGNAGSCERYGCAKLLNSACIRFQVTTIQCSDREQCLKTGCKMVVFNY